MRERCPFHVGLILGVVVCALTATSVAIAGPTPRELFERGETLYRQLEKVDPTASSPAWSSVIEAFAELKARFPDSALAPEAVWRLAGIHRQRATVGEASATNLEVAAYQELVREYPDSPHTPEALLRLAVGSEQVGEGGGVEAARLYAMLLQRYPDTPQASLARNRLTRVEAEAGAALAAANARNTGPEESGLEPPGDADAGAAAEAEGVGQGHPAADDEIATAPASGDLLPAPSSDGLALLQGIRHYSDDTHTRVVIDLDRPVGYEAGEATDPARVFIDIAGVGLPGDLPDAVRSGAEQVVAVDGEAVRRVRLASNRPGVARVVLDLGGDTPHTIFTLDREGQPFRIVVDVPTAAVAGRVNARRRPRETDGDMAVAQQLGLGVRRIVIDPGHGGEHPGAIGRSGITEKELTLELGNLLAERLEAQGYDVILTRAEDRTVGLEERTAFANSNDADLFISLHINAARSRSLRGFETYYLNLATDPTAKETAARENAAAQTSLAELEGLLEQIVSNEYKEASSSLAAAIQDNLVMQVSKRYDDIRDLGVKHAPFVVLVGAEMPAVLVETSFLSNPEEEERLRSATYREQVADAIAIGVQSYIERRLTTSHPLNR